MNATDSNQLARAYADHPDPDTLARLTLAVAAELGRAGAVGQHYLDRPDLVRRLVIARVNAAVMTKDAR